MKRILSLVIALILYGSFYPWHFHARDLPFSPAWMLLHSWPAFFDRTQARDAAVNLTLYVPFGVFCFLSMSEARSRPLRAAITLLAGVALSASVEMTQLFDIGRVCSLFDVTCNAAGTALGTALATTFPHRISKVVHDAQTSGTFRLSGVIALLYLWAGYLLFPFIPVLSLFAVRLKLGVFLTSGISIHDFLDAFAGWLAASALFESLVGRRRARRLIPVALLAVPLELLIVNRATSRSEILGAILGAALWFLLGGYSRRMPAAGVFALGALVIGGLVPFDFTGVPLPFTWVPFLSLLQTPWEAAFLILLKKSFLYGAAVWLFRESGYGWFMSTVAVAFPLAIVEALQVYLPDRTAEVTDPLLSILMGLSLMLLERHKLEQRNPEKLLAGF